MEYMILTREKTRDAEWRSWSIISPNKEMFVMIIQHLSKTIPTQEFRLVRLDTV